MKTLRKARPWTRVFRYLATFGLLLYSGLSFPMAAGAASGATKNVPVFHWVRSIYGINQPIGVAVNGNGNVFVSQTSKLSIYDPQDKLIKQITKPANKYLFSDLFQLSFDNDTNRLLAPDFNANTVWEFDQNGNYLNYLPQVPKGDSKDLAHYDAHTFHAYSVVEYNGDYYVGTINDIYVFNEDGKLLRRFGELGPFQFINGLAVDKQRGVFYVADSLNRRVIAMTPTGRVLWTAGTPDKNGNIQSFFNLPRGIAVGPDGDIYVADTFLDQIDVLSPQGSLVGVYASEGPADGSFDYPDGLFIVPPLNMWQRFLAYLFHDTVVLGLGGAVGALLLWRVWRSPHLQMNRKAAGSLALILASAMGVAGVNAIPGLNQSVLGGNQPLLYLADHGNNRVEVFQLGALPKPTVLQISNYQRGFVKGRLVPKGTSQIPLVRF